MYVMKMLFVRYSRTNYWEGHSHFYTVKHATCGYNVCAHNQELAFILAVAFELATLLPIAADVTNGSLTHGFQIELLQCTQLNIT